MALPPKGYTRAPVAGNSARTEAWALLESARALEDSKTKGSEALLAAARRNWRLWTIFQASLSDDNCPMPIEPRRNLLTLANFIDRQTVLVLSEPKPEHVDALVNINRQIGEGLLEGARNSATKQQTPAPAPVGSLRESA
ncbi:MAG TPA: flagellar biosynthesis regulator FlaF [Stellaceae bacterium]|nr:flagellar biosynthesis regulator FlaF [Stellaceae bacterium]